MSQAAVKVAERLSKNNAKEKAAKKSVNFTGKIYQKTRLGKELYPSSKSVAAFNLKNFKLAKDMPSLKYQMSKFGELVDAQFDLIDLNMNEKAEVVSHLLKQFQLAGIFTHVDSAIFTAAENLVGSLKKGENTQKMF